MSEDSKLVIKPKMPPFGGIKKGIAATRHENEQKIKTINPQECTNRLGLIIDDSGSMGHSGMEEVHKGVRGFTESCNPLDTSICVYPLNAGEKALVVDYDLINIYMARVWNIGSTPLYTKLDQMIQKESITRAVVFSDGGPTDFHLNLEDVLELDTKDIPLEEQRKLAKFIKNQATDVLDKYVAKSIPIDTIYIGEDKDWSGKQTSSYTEMKYIAEYTGGTFVNMKDSKTLGMSLKYLAPKYRALLSNADLKAKIERGEQI